MTCCTAQKAAQNISASLVGWHNAIGNHEGAGLDMIRYNTQRNIGLMIFLIFGMCQLADTV